MSAGVVVGTRLDRLVELRGQIDQAIAVERAAIARGDRAIVRRPFRVTPAAAPVLPPRRQEPPPRSLVVTVPVSLVIPKVIRDWGAVNGYPTSKTGIIPNILLEEFVRAHQ